MRSAVRGPPAGVGGGIRWLSYRGIGNIMLRLDLKMRAYPFDTQTIPVTVWHKDDWVLKPTMCTTPPKNPGEPDGSYASTFDQEKVERNMEDFTCRDKKLEKDSPNYIAPGEPGYSPHLNMTVAYRKAKGRVRPALTIGLRVNRKPGFFYYNYFGPLFLIGGCRKRLFRAPFSH